MVCSCSALPRKENGSRAVAYGLPAMAHASIGFGNTDRGNLKFTSGLRRIRQAGSSNPSLEVLEASCELCPQSGFFGVVRRLAVAVSIGWTKPRVGCHVPTRPKSSAGGTSWRMWPCAESATRRATRKGNSIAMPGYRALRFGSCLYVATRIGHRPLRHLAGFPSFTDEQGERILERGIGPQGETLRPPMHIYHMKHEDAVAIIAYLKSSASLTSLD